MCGECARRSARSSRSEPGAWSAIAAELGYTDQPHLIRDVAELTGFTPLALQARLAMIEHESVTP